MDDKGNFMAVLDEVIMPGTASDCRPLITTNLKRHAFKSATGP